VPDNGRLRCEVKTVRRIFRHKMACWGGVLVLIISLAAAMASFLPLQDPYRLSISAMYAAPSAEHLFGTDSFGRDILSRVIFGCQVSLRVGCLVAFVSTVVGGIIGLVAGFHKVLDNIIMRCMDAMMALPAILLALAIVSILNPSELNTIVALSIVYTPRTARVVRGAVLSIREETYIEAARAVGCSDSRIIARYLAPNVLAPLLIQATFIFAYSILAEAGLSFLGAGAPPPTPSLGNILSEARPVLRSAPWVAVFPGVVIMLLVAGINLIGDAVRDVLDPRLETQQ